MKGIFHCSAKQSFTKYDMSCVIADVFSLPKDHIKPDLNVEPNMRPNNANLDTSYSFKVIDFEPVMLFKDSIKDCLENFVV